MPSDDPNGGILRADIAGFADHLCRACQGSRPRTIPLSWPAIFALEQRDWIDRSELAKVVAAAVARAEDDRSEAVERRHIFAAQEEFASLEEATERFREQYLLAALEREQWNISAVARLLRLSRAHVYNLMIQFGIPRTRLREP